MHKKETASPDGRCHIIFICCYPQIALENIVSLWMKESKVYRFNQRCSTKSFCPFQFFPSISLELFVYDIFTKITSIHFSQKLFKNNKKFPKLHRTKNIECFTYSKKTSYRMTLTLKCHKMLLENFLKQFFFFLGK